MRTIAYRRGSRRPGRRRAGTRDSGLVFQQSQGGVITDKNDQAGTPAYITTGKIRRRGIPHATQTAHLRPPEITVRRVPPGFPTSDVNPVGDLFASTFEHGKIEYIPKTDQVEATVNGKVVPRGP